ncbi:aspartate/glutamate racemase family protein [Oceanobacillus jeddahense]|uniref:aspartate/glutamate racemase family protein n=1 Tax=Oceanobacillus jeddahense TaxID=1462527 RepID=UPI001B7D7731|nr:amino acid racemase [Oceanobacillus jeddahense]
MFINSINMYNIFQYITEWRLNDLIAYVSDARKLEQLGVDDIIIAASTPHLVFDEVQKQVTLPMISIVDATVKEAKRQEVHHIGLLGTKFTMEQDFFKTPFEENGKCIYVPEEVTQQYLHKKIVNELENGIVNPDTKKFKRIVDDMIKQEKIDSLILGCTELPMIFSEEDFDIPLIDTMDIHVNKIVDFMFENK